MKTVHAIYEGGVFRPTDPVDLPENCPVMFEPRVVRNDAAPTKAMARIYEILSRSYDDEDAGLSERHNEH